MTVTIIAHIRGRQALPPGGRAAWHSARSRAPPAICAAAELPAAAVRPHAGRYRPPWAS
ncbi:MAG TPA: hypothetical protein VK162_25075 [Streptosporangiaceae bacterium]|nr:hypothetical protein [Streptosporangiaceae bacterium]